MSSPSVDLVINCYERTYRDVLAPGFFEAVAESNRFAFARRVALINNVDDPADAERRARELVAHGSIDAFAFVASMLPDALGTTGLSLDDLGDARHYTDCAIVAVCLSGSPWLLYWDAEVELETPADWISPSVEVMERERSVLVANPAWEADTARSVLRRETIRREGDFALGLGMSDQIFLARREDLARPIYGQRCVSRLRYPQAIRGLHVFEARLDAYMRHNGRLRATHTAVRYTHPPAPDREKHGARSLSDRLRYVRNGIALRAARAMPVQRECWRHL